MINIYDLWFSNIDIRNNKKLELLERFQCSENIWNSKKQDFEDMDLNEKILDKILDENNKKNVEKYANYMKNKNIKLISYKDEVYPKKLKVIYDKPVFLYVRGNIENLFQTNIAIVGSREASTYGKNTAKKISKELADRGINIVSGLAVGIDKYAHLGALESQVGKTIAVLGTGISDEEFYPYENKKVYDRILENGGTIVSEFKLGTKANKYNFPHRNRIISGLAEKIVIVEAKEKSGSLITADFALEQGKDVFAVPGNIDSITSKGTNKLIYDGANIFTASDDLF